MNGFLENLSNIMTGKRQKTINMSLDDIVSMLHTSPEALEAF